MHVLDVFQDSNQVTSMILEDWCQAQEVDPILGLVIARLHDGTLGKGQSKAADPPLKSVNLGENRIILFLKRVYFTEKPDKENQRRPSFSWFYWQPTGRWL